MHQQSLPADIHPLLRGTLTDVTCIKMIQKISNFILITLILTIVIIALVIHFSFSQNEINNTIGQIVNLPKVTEPQIVVDQRPIQLNIINPNKETK